MKRVYGWAVVRYVITKFSRMDSLLIFLTHGAPLRAREELRYHGQEFMAQRLSHQRGSTVFFNFSDTPYITKTKRCASAGLWQLM